MLYPFVTNSCIPQRLKDRATDWQNIASQFEDEAKSSKKTAKVWKQKSDAEHKKRQDAKAKAAMMTKTIGELEAEVETLTKADLDLKDRIVRMEEHEVTKSALANAEERYRGVAEVAAPLVDAGKQLN